VTVYPSEAHRRYFNDEAGVVIYSSADERLFTYTPGTMREFLLWLGPVNIRHKRVDTAIRVARLANELLLIVGTGSINHEGFLGPVWGQDKVKLLCRVRAVLVLGEIEAGPITCVEAALCGTPVIGRAAGGIPEYIADGLSGYVCACETEMVEAVGRLDALPGPEEIRAWALRELGRERMLAAYEAVLRQVIKQAE